MKRRLLPILVIGVVLLGACTVPSSEPKPFPPPAESEPVSETEGWCKTLGGSHGDHGNSVAQTSDGGYIIAGYTMSYGSGSADVWLIKTNSNGDQEWDKTFGEAGSDSA